MVGKVMADSDCLGGASAPQWDSIGSEEYLLAVAQSQPARLRTTEVLAPPRTDLPASLLWLARCAEAFEPVCSIHARHVNALRIK